MHQTLKAKNSFLLDVFMTLFITALIKLIDVANLVSIFSHVEEERSTNLILIFFFSYVEEERCSLLNCRDCTP